MAIKNSIKQFYMEYCEAKSGETNELTSKIQRFVDDYDKIVGKDNNQDNVIVSIEQFAKEFGKIQDNDGSDIKHQLNQFCKSYLPFYEKECADIDKRRREFISYDKTGINYQDVFGIARSEESYTQFMEWLLDHEGSHGLRNKPLNLFLKKIVNDEFDFRLDDDIEVDAEKGKDGDYPDLMIKRTVKNGAKDNFTCIIEIKISSREGKDQTVRYYKTYRNEPNPFFVYLTLYGDKAKKSGNGRTGFKSTKWDEVILKVLSPLLKQSKSSALRGIISSVIFNLKVNKFSSSGDREFFYNGEYKNADYPKLKGVLQENNKEDDNE